MEDFNITEETIMQEPQKQPEEPKPKKAKNPMTKRVLSGAAILAWDLAAESAAHIVTMR